MTTHQPRTADETIPSAVVATSVIPRVIPTISRRTARKQSGNTDTQSAPRAPRPVLHAGMSENLTVDQSGSGKNDPGAAAIHPTRVHRVDELNSRLISETAHDLRAPLTTIREAVRIVRDGDLGHLSTTQKECLSAAINQCNCASQLVDEMVQSSRFDSGFPNVKRDWISIDEVRQSVADTLQPFVLPRDIHLLWDGPFGRGEMVYGDPALLRRLIVNLANNAIRVTRDGQPVLIRLYSSAGKDTMSWSVVDQGSGISAPDMELIAAGRAPARSVGGLGLMISRQLAAAHFSSLRIESRVGTGTAVSFTTPINGPSSVAAQWAAWRCNLMAGQSSSLLDHGRQVHNVIPNPAPNRTGKPSPPRRVRIDVPSLSVELGLDSHRPVHSNQLVLSTVAIGAAVGSQQADEFELLVARSLRVTEFSYRVDRRHWIIAWDADNDTAIGKRAALQASAETELPDVRLTWGSLSSVLPSPGNQTLNESALTNRLSDLIVRQALLVSRRTFADADQVRLGTDPIQHSAIASHRLEKEVRRLKTRP